MSSISELLVAPVESFVKKTLPEGDYLLQVVEIDIKHYFWKASPAKSRGPVWGDAVVPTIEIVDMIPSGDSTLDDQQLSALNAFGDWKGFRPPYGSGRWTQYQEVQGYKDKIECAGISPINFPLAIATPEWASMVEIHPQATRFYTSANSRGEPDGFVVKVLSTEPTRHVPPVTSALPLGEVISACKGCFFVATFSMKEDETGQYDPKLEITAVTSV
jgi:hypothetical protein